MTATTQWIKRNMYGIYSEELGRPLTDAEIRVQRCLERLSVPDWYLKYSRPQKILKNGTPFECRPASWKTYKGKSATSPKKTPKKRSPKNSPKKLKPDCLESTRTSSADSGYNERQCTSPKTPKEKFLEDTLSPSTSSNAGSDCSKTSDESPARSHKTSRDPLNTSNTFPQMSRSRKIENINIVFPQPFPPEHAEPLDIADCEPTASTPKTTYTMTKKFHLDPDADCSGSSGLDSTHASFLIAEVQPGRVTTHVHVFAGPEEELPARCSPSPGTRFFNSTKKSTELERIVQSGRSDSGSLIQQIIGELDRSVAEGRSICSGAPLSSESRSFAKSMLSALKHSFEEDEDSGSDSDLAKSTSISFDSADEPHVQLSASGEESEESSEEEDVCWIRCKPRHLPRTSSRLSVASRPSSSRSGCGRNSPGLSPIRGERRDEWTTKQQKAPWNADRATRQLFRIDETGVLDSGYSDRSETASSRTATLSTNRSSPASSLSSSPTLVESQQSRTYPKCEGYILKSFMV